MAKELYHHEITPSWTALFRVLIVGFALYLIWQLNSVIIIVILSAMLSSALYPLVRFFNKWCSLTLASIITMAILTVPLIVSIAVIVPNFIDQFPGLLKTLNVILIRSTFLPESLRHVDLTQYTQSGVSYLFIKFILPNYGDSNVNHYHSLYDTIYANRFSTIK